MPEDGGDLALAPFLSNAIDGSSFFIRCFSTLPGLQLCSYNLHNEWQQYYTYKLKWGPQRQIELLLSMPSADGAVPSSGAEGGAAKAVAFRFPGVPADSAVDIDWEEQGGPSSREPETMQGVQLDGASLTFTVGTASSYRVGPTAYLMAELLDFPHVGRCCCCASLLSRGFSDLHAHTDNYR